MEEPCCKATNHREFGILGTLNYEAKVNGDPLVANGSTLGILLVAVGLAELGASTDRTGVELGSNRQVGYTNNKAVHFQSAAGVEMAKTLMPKNPELIS